ncbi:type II toxin-antitoxin system RelE/ParE family toxin [Paratractidigestivibacter sp.]|uniref:type II toxin-antitoxin system RelE/ParE family toxin n=1 Tax=Paratractidigestivibacter sp. TaxID=2847316 RepID=UPI002ABD2B7A|nr:type II toxin-antitoxin system RelE/ParE family toxin [Paratractidigestivibacter sp.]
MAFNVEVSNEFQANYIEASDYLVRCNESGKAVANLAADVEGLMHLLAEFPRMYPVREEESRKAGIELGATAAGRYILYYHVGEWTVHLYALRHQLPDPGAADWAALAGE